MAMDGIHAEHDQAALLDADSDDQVSLPVEAWGAASASRSSSSGSKRAASDMQLLEGGRLAGELSHHLQAERPRAGLAKYRWYVHRYVDNIYVRLFGVVLIVIDVSITLARLSKDRWRLSGDVDNGLGLEVVSSIIVVYFFIDVCLRIFALGPRNFFRNPFEVFDFLVIFLSFIFEFALEAARFVVLARVVRIFIVLRFLTEQYKMKKATRLRISENKRRYREDGFDLDLTYITDRVIAMSFPSSGTTAIYRNPIEEVARFFNTKYKGHYLIVNCCGEKKYDTACFDDCVTCVHSLDHNVPKLLDLLNFCQMVYRYMAESEQNVIAVHCKGGKGRTGTLICSWLLYCGKFTSATAALDYFAQRRTDLSVSDQYQGVETPSQGRYVGYIEKIVLYNDRTLRAPIVRVIKCIRVHKLHVISTNLTGARNLTFTVLDADENCLYSSVDMGLKFVRGPANYLEFDLGSGVAVEGDTKIRFYADGLPAKYDDCAFFFWFHSNMIVGDSLFLGREELDNPHKRKAWKYYKEGFAVEVFFAPLSA